MFCKYIFLQLHNHLLGKRMNRYEKISVIIAAYNAEEYLSETMDSIFLQTMDNSEYEVIVINDGSSDNTLSILNSYKKNYPNLIIIDKENGGPSSARNAGLDIAQENMSSFLMRTIF